MSIKDGPSCTGCGLPNYEGLCPHCRGDQDAYERELVPPFPSSIPDEDEDRYGFEDEGLWKEPLEGAPPVYSASPLAEVPSR